MWRADRPQKGRYQEFYQCDVDVVGSNSLMFEAELAQIYDEVFAQLGINVTIKVNNRKILSGIAEIAGISDRMVEMTVIIDKLDKIGLEGIEKEFIDKQFDPAAVEKVLELLQTEQINSLEEKLATSETARLGLNELKTFFEYINLGEQTNNIKYDITLARGLSYYTGCIFEVVANDVKMGSIGGGGRYDDLTGVFGLKNLSGVGVSFGAERIFDVMEELDLFPKDYQNKLQLLFVAFDDATHKFAFQYLQSVRKAGLIAELYPEPLKLKKQMKYANARNVPFVALVGQEEMESNSLTLKEMGTGKQESFNLQQLINKLKGETILV